MKPYTLVVIDMQPVFPAAEEVLYPVIDLIKSAMVDKSNIVVVEYSYDGSVHTYEQILDKIENYPLKAIVKKRQDNGSKQVQEALHSFEHNNELKICGVNLCCCVRDTALGLSRSKKFKIEVVRNACNDEEGFEDYVVLSLGLFKRNGITLV